MWKWGTYDKIKVKTEDEILSQLSIHTVNEIPAKAFVRMLASRESYQNWKIELVLVVLKKVIIHV